MLRFFNWKILLILIIFLASVLRLYQLGNIPYGVIDDEANYIYNAYSIWNTGRDVQGNFLPLSFNAYSSASPVVVYLISPFVGILGVSSFSGRILSSLMGICSVYLIFLISDFLFKNKRVALLSSLLFSISPWALQVARGSFLDVNFSLFFLLSGLYIFIPNASGKKYLWSLIPFALAFYSYHATKVYFLFLIPVLLFFFRAKLFKHIKSVTLFLIICAFFFISFLFVIKSQGVTRQVDVNLFNNIYSAKQVNLERTYSNAPIIFRQIFSNKPLHYLKTMRENFLGPFSLEFLFLYGDTGPLSGSNNISQRGELYIIELPLLLIGLYLLLKNKNRFLKTFIFTLLIIGALPSTFTIDKSFVNRNIMLLPVLIIIVAYGLSMSLDKILKFKKFYRLTLFLTIIIVYFFLFSSYLYQYYFRWPIYGAEGVNSNSRDLSSLIMRNKDKYSNIYLSKQGYDFLLVYGIYEKTDPRILQGAWGKNPAQIGSLRIYQNCINNGVGYTEKFLPKNTLYISSFVDCHYLSTPSAKIVDRGEPLRIIWNIYEN